MQHIQMAIIMTKPAPDSPYTTVDSKIAYQNQFMTIVEDQIIHPDGRPGVYSYRSLSKSVAIVPVDRDGGIYLVEVWRYPIQRFAWEIPMGGIESADESPLVAAQRELLEEAGLKAQQWSKLARIHPCPSVSDEQAIYFVAQQVQQQPHTDTNEVSQVKKFTLKQINQLIESGQLTNGQAITAILMAQRKFPELFPST